LSILGGFDAVIELGVNVIAEKLRSVSVGGSSLNPPTELSFGDTTNGADFLILDAIDVSLVVGESGIVAKVPFDESTIYYNGHTVRPLKGVITITGRIAAGFVNPTDFTSTLCDLFLVLPGGNAVVQVSWDTGAATQNALGSLSSTDRQDMEAKLKTQVWNAINRQRPSASLNFNMDDSRDGLLGKYGLRFRSVLVQNIDANTIGVFCMALLSTSTPNAPDRTEQGQVGKIGVAMSVSPGMFQRLVFCPAIAEKLMSAWDPKTQTADDFMASVSANLPSQCGTGDFVKLSGYSIPLLGSASLKDIATTFQDGSVLVSGKIVAGVASNDYCWRIAIDFNSNAYLSVVNGAVQIKLDPDPPNTSSYVDVNWYCAPLYIVPLAVAAAPTAGIILGSPYIDGITSMLVSKLVNKPLNLNQTEQVGLDGLHLGQVDVKPDRMTLHGSVATTLVPAPNPRGVTLEITGEQILSQVLVGSGTYHYPGSMTCKAKPYPYDEFTQQDVRTVTATATLMGSAPTFTWKIEGQPLTNPSGTLEVSVPATIPQPGDFPGKDTVSLGLQKTTVDYQVISPTEIQLTPHGTFDYAVNVAVECTSLENFASTDNLFVNFTDRVIAMGGNYEQDMEQCALATRLLVGKLRTRPQATPLGEVPNYDETVEILGEAIATNKVGATEALGAAGQVFGNRIFEDVLNAIGNAE
jgi:hypothetical protein